MNKILKNKTILGIACIMLSLSLSISLALIPLFNEGMEAKVQVVRVTENIKEGEMITARMIKAVEVGGFNIPESVVKNKENIIGKYAKADLHKGDLILISKLSNEPLVSNKYLHNFTGEERAISVSIKSLAIGLSGKLEAGDIVSIMVTDFRGNSGASNPVELRFVEVLAVTADSGWDVDEYRKEEDEIVGEDRKLPATITLKVSDEQAKLLAEIETNADMHIVLVYRGKRENAEKFLKEQENLLSRMRDGAYGTTEAVGDYGMDDGTGNSSYNNPDKESLESSGVNNNQIIGNNETNEIAEYNEDSDTTTDFNASQTDEESAGE
ncbi:MAG: Flp pilus assembly protein CpaB [Alkaliphilus sp.]